MQTAYLKFLNEALLPRASGHGLRSAEAGAARRGRCAAPVHAGCSGVGSGIVAASLSPPCKLLVGVPEEQADGGSSSWRGILDLEAVLREEIYLGLCAFDPAAEERSHLTYFGSCALLCLTTPRLPADRCASPPRTYCTRISARLRPGLVEQGSCSTTTESAVPPAPNTAPEVRHPTPDRAGCCGGWGEPILAPGLACRGAPAAVRHPARAPSALFAAPPLLARPCARCPSRRVGSFGLLESP